MKLKQTIITILIAIITALGGGYTAMNLGSTQDGQAYTSVTTATGLSYKDLLKLGGGTLGSVVITGAGAGTFELYDATTTNSTLRTITATSSLKKIMSFPASAAAGTYTCDCAFSQGLIAAFVGVQGTTTITFR